MPLAAIIATIGGGATATLNGASATATAAGTTEQGSSNILLTGALAAI